MRRVCREVSGSSVRFCFRIFYVIASRDSGAAIQSWLKTGLDCVASLAMTDFWKLCLGNIPRNLRNPCHELGGVFVGAVACVPIIAGADIVAFVGKGGVEVADDG